MKVRITLITGATIDFDAPHDFNLIGWVTSVREVGRFLLENIYVPHSSILFVCRLGDDLLPVQPKIEETLQ